MQVYEAWSAERAAEIIAQHVDQAGALPPMLHGLQAAFGCIPEPVVPDQMLTLCVTDARSMLIGLISIPDHSPFRSLVFATRVPFAKNTGSELAPM